MNPLLSIIVPIYKVEPYLRACLDSILRQKFTDYELILVNDGSPDNCGEICEEYASADSRIIVIHKDNGGLSSARNAGLDVAHGDYITFVDPDDELEETYEKNLHIFSKNKNIDILQFPFFSEQNDRLWIPLKSRYISEKDLYANWLTYDDLIPSVCNKIFKRQIFYHARFVNFVSEDILLLNELFLAKNTVYTSNYGKYIYKFRSNSISHSLTTEKLIGSFYVEYTRYKSSLKFNDLKYIRVYLFMNLLGIVCKFKKMFPDKKNNLSQELRLLVPSLRNILMAKNIHYKDRLKLAIYKFLGLRAYFYFITTLNRKRNSH